jgi:sialic acid synthase SpsE
MSNLNILDTQKRLEKAEKLIEVAKKTREDAIKKKTESLTKLEMSKEELAKLGITPENAQTELERLENQILSELETIEGEIPVELLRQLGRI